MDRQLPQTFAGPQYLRTSWVDSNSRFSSVIDMPPRYLHQWPDWPTLAWEEGALATRLGRVRHLQDRLLDRTQSLDFEVERQVTLETLTSGVVKSSAIEGESPRPGPGAFIHCLVSRRRRRPLRRPAQRGCCPGHPRLPLSVMTRPHRGTGFRLARRSVPHRPLWPLAHTVGGYRTGPKETPTARQAALPALQSHPEAAAANDHHKQHPGPDPAAPGPAPLGR